MRRYLEDLVALLSVDRWSAQDVAFYGFQHKFIDDGRKFKDEDRY